MLKEGSSMKRIFYRLFPALIIPVIAVLCFFPLAPAFADMKKVDEAELARANASVTGASVKDQTGVVEKAAVSPELWRDSGTLDKDGAVISPSLGKAEGTSVDMNINGQGTLHFYRGETNMNMTGGITSVTPRP